MMIHKIFACTLLLALAAVVSCGGPDIVIDLRGDGGVTDGGATSTDAAPTPTPGPTTRIEIRCPVQSDSQCQLYAWWGHNRSATGRGTIAADIDRGELCVWGLDTNAQTGAGGAWYDTLRENQSVADSPRWLLRLNPVYVAGNPTIGVVVTDSFGTNLFVSKTQLGCP